MKRLSCTLLLIATLMVAFTSCKRSRSKIDAINPTQTVRLNIAHEPGSLDPRKARALGDINLIKMFMEGLTRVNTDGESSLALAKKVEVSDDGLEYRFTLRKAKWSNGEVITSHDFAYTWKKSLHPTFNSPNAYLLYAIKNAKEVKLGQLPSSLLGVETPDSQTLVVKLHTPTPYFLELVEHPIFFPVNEQVDRLNPSWAEDQTSFVGSGPFSINEWRHHNVIEAGQNPEYWDRKAVKLKRLKMFMVSEETGFSMFGSHELDWDGSPFSVIPPDAIASLKANNKLETSPMLGTLLIRINVDRFPFQSQKIRRAFGLAINRHDLAQHVMQGGQIPATGIVPKMMGLQDRPYFQDGDIEEAAELFEEGLNEMGIKRSKMPEIVFTYVSIERNQSIAQALQQQWYAALGVRVRLEPVEMMVYFSQISKQNYTLSLGNWYADFNDPVSFLSVFETKTNGTNNTNWENASYKELLDTSNLCQDAHERYDLLRQCEQIISQEMPAIPVLYYTFDFVKDQDLQNVALTKTGSIDFKWAYLNKH